MLKIPSSLEIKKEPEGNSALTNQSAQELAQALNLLRTISTLIATKSEAAIEALAKVDKSTNYRASAKALGIDADVLHDLAQRYQTAMLTEPPAKKKAARKAEK